MHVSGFPLDLNLFLQFLLTAFIVFLGLLYLVKNTAPKYFMVDSNFESSDPQSPHRMPAFDDACAVCSNTTKKQCSGCKMVRYCSETCQRTHWNTGHKVKCKDLRLSGKVNSVHSMSRDRRALIAAPPHTNGGTSKVLIKKVLFPYEEFVELFNWGKQDSPPCGLLNCGNSCFANVVLQCLTYTRPLVAYLLKKGHRTECRRNDWCFLCEFEIHVERASQSRQAFSPINILSRLPNIGGNLGYGKQEDAHEFMRFAIDTMQSVCLDEFGGEKAVHPTAQETTLIQHIFGGHLQSQVICTKCNNVSNQFENMMDLTVEIHGDAASLEECLDQFTAREGLHGDNMYKCDGCNEYVQAWKRLTILRAPNILTIALKRFQSGRFGKLNKRVTFPEDLDLSPYMSEETGGSGDDVYKLYAVVVHVDMLNASFFGHYICYTKDFSGNWYRIDDYKVNRVELDEVLSQGAYMLLYSRIRPRPTCLNPLEKEEKITEMSPSAQETVDCSDTESMSTSTTVKADPEEENSSFSKDIVLVRENGDSDEALQVTVCPVVQNDDDGYRLINGNGANSSCTDNHGVDALDSAMMTTTENHVGENGATVPEVNETGKEKLNGKIYKEAKPLFAPGFLGKRPRNKDIKLEVGESSSSATFDLINGQTNGSHQNGSLSSDFIEKQTGKSMDVDRTVSIESDTTSLHNGGDSENNIMIVDG